MILHFSIGGLCRFVSGLYSKTQLSSPVILYPAGLVQFPDIKECPCRRALSALSGRREQFRDHLCTDLVHSQIFGNDSPHSFLHMDSSLAIIRTVKRRSALTSCFTCSVLSAVLLVEGLPELRSSSTSSRPSLNRLCHSNTRVRNMALLPYTCCTVILVSCPAEQEISGWFSAQDLCREDC